MPLLTNKFLLTAVMLLAAAMLLGTAWLGDDAFITLRVIDNLVNGYGLRFNVIERVQVFTHPLWMMLLTPFYALTREPLVTTMLVSVLVSLAALWILAARLAKDIAYGSLLVLIAMASRAISQFSTSGLETPLTFLLLALLVRQVFRMERVWIPAGIIGLLLLNRLDLAVLLGPVAAYLLFRARGPDRIKVAAAAMLPALAWMVFSTIYYGSPLPNTAYAKLGTGFGAEQLILRGLAYTKDFVLHDPILALVIGKSVFDALRFRDWAEAALGAGIACYIAYTIVIGGDFMSGRFFAAPGFLALCLLARKLPPRWMMKRARMIGLIGVGLLGVLLVMRVMEQPISGDVGDITDERRFYYADNGLLPVVSAWISTGKEPIHPWGQEFKLMGQGAKTPVVVAAQVIGMRGYYGGRMVHIVDELALADAFLARLPAIPGTRVGHYRRLLPREYPESVLNVFPTVNNEQLRPLLNDVILATRAPLFAHGRWSAIWPIELRLLQLDLSGRCQRDRIGYIVRDEEN